MPKNFKEIGNDVRLEVAGEDFPITNASYTEDADVAETQFNTGLNPSIVVTGVTYSGSFEHSGANGELRDALYNSGEDDELPEGTSLPQQVGTITIIDSQREYEFDNCIVESRDKDFPADDRTEVTYDFMAEELIMNERTDESTLGLGRQDTENTPGFVEEDDDE